MKCLVIALDRCRPDFLGPYGNDWLTTGTLDRLAATGVVFDWHFSEHPTEGGARRAWRTGRFPADLTQWPVGLAELLWDHGIQTALILDERSPTVGGRFAHGWETVRVVRSDRLEDLEQDSLLGGTVQSAIEWLQDHGRSQPWLLWLELASLRPPWDPAEFDADAVAAGDGEREPDEEDDGPSDEADPEQEEADPTRAAPPEGDEAGEGPAGPFEPWFDPPGGELAETEREAAVERLQTTYGGVVSAVDQWLGQLFAYLDEARLADDLLVIVTGDCGLLLGETGFVGDGPAHVRQELVHLPLIVKLPGRVGAGRRVAHLTQAVDLLPTLLAAFGVERPEWVHGHSLLDMARGEGGRVRTYACSRLRRAGEEEWSIRTPDYHLTVPVADRPGSPRPPRLFLKPEDRWDVQDVASLHPAVADHLELVLRRFLSACAHDRLAELPPLNEELLRR
jgi:arylsulfatase A-like enzyme